MNDTQNSTDTEQQEHKDTDTSLNDPKTSNYSQTSNNTLVNNLETTMRMDSILDMIVHHGFTHEQCAKELGVTRRTVERDISNWGKSDRFTAYLFTKWVSLVNVLSDTGDKQDRREVLRCYTQLLKRSGFEVTMLNKDSVTGIRIVFGDMPVTKASPSLTTQDTTNTTIHTSIKDEHTQ